MSGNDNIFNFCSNIISALEISISSLDSLDRTLHITGYIPLSLRRVDRTGLFPFLFLSDLYAFITRFALTTYSILCMRQVFECVTTMGAPLKVEVFGAVENFLSEDDKEIFESGEAETNGNSTAITLMFLSTLEFSISITTACF